MIHHEEHEAKTFLLFVTFVSFVVKLFRFDPRKQRHRFANDMSIR